MDKTAIDLSHVSKKFCKDLKHTVKYGLFDMANGVFGLKSDSSKLRQQEFWALNNISFKLKKGETLGVIGPNGSGKSTLLKILNGIFPPDKGTVRIKGKVGALIEVGAGFHPMLTGRENIYINGTILGMSKKEINEKFDKIVKFAAIGDFLDVPVKNYSSGMHVRLGFAIAAHCQPDILLIDEVLAVGDVEFRAKCYHFISDITKEAAVVFVSHSMEVVAKICNKILVIDKGKCLFKGNVNSGINKYYSLLPVQRRKILGTSEAQIKNLKFLKIA